MAAFPCASTATQNEVDAHDKAPGPVFVSMVVGRDQDRALKVTTRTSSAAPANAMQNVADAHETSKRSSRVPIALGFDQLCLL